ncbi:SRPBCC family protein [Streptomyces sp. NRRL F-5123]|uniref:SRPBCC family protein n=1 Tax=Streptomyces sp. NRRL F-5123 TaxID=1463856 RepID=UPI00099CD4B3|nr:SRPBCC domain-containing protein [Streptomyces sp. NRRL F-5123]
MTTQQIRLERTCNAAPERIWELWTTGAGIEAWWAPEGFTVRVDALDLRVGGTLTYTMTATGPEQIAFMESAGLPLGSTSHKTFTEVQPARRLAYATLADFVPGVEPYEFLTEVELRATADGGTRVTMTADSMHDEEWTARLAAGRAAELDNLVKVAGTRDQRRTRPGRPVPPLGRNPGHGER